MGLFLLSAIPLFSFTITTYYYRDRYSVTLPLLTFLKGVVCFFLSLIFYLIIRSFFPLSFTAGGFFLFHLIYDHLLYFILAIGGIFLFKGIPDSYNQQENIFETFVFLSGFYSLVAFVDFIEHFSEFNIFILFFLPLLRIATLLCITVFLVQLINEVSYLRFAFLCGLIATPFILSFITVLFLTNHTFLAIMFTLILLGGVFPLFYVLKDR
jgi:hypothetical protein